MREDERELERVMRDGLARLARSTDVGAPVAARARDGLARRRRRARTAVAVVAAAAVVLALGLAGGLRAGDHRRVPAAAGPASMPGAAPGHRWEVWHGIGVQVPATWGWGAAPRTRGTGTPVLCGGAVVRADGSRHDETGQPYVGRPIALSDVCDTTWTTARPSAPYVWLGADLDPGSVELGGGWTRQTVRVAGVTVTVAADDAALRREVLGSARRLETPCPARLDAPPRPGGEDGGEEGGEDGAAFVPESLVACAYAATRVGGSYDLLAQEGLTQGAAKALASAVAASPGLGSSSCTGASGGEWALLRMRGSGDSYRDLVVDLSCPGIADQTATQHRLTAQVMDAWAVGAMNAVLHARPGMDPGRLIRPWG